MLDHLFLQILNMSFTASFVILFVLVVRFFLRKAPKIFSYSLWSVVLFRLFCPFSFESLFSLLPTKANPISQDIVYMQTPKIDTGVVVINNAVNTVLPAATPQSSVNPLQVWIFIGSLIWLLGIAALLAYSLVTLLRLKKRLQNASLYKDNIFLSDAIDTPFVMGLIRPKIYLPSNLIAEEKIYILLHEQTHIRRFDHVVRIISFFMLCVHWFNPLVWLAFFMSAKDMEMSCDESVIKQLGNGVKKDYSSSLLTLATGRRNVSGIPLAFGEGDTRGRIKNVLNYKKPAFWVIVVCVIIVVMVCIGLMVDPKSGEKFQDNSSAEFMEFKTEYVGDSSKVNGIIKLLTFPEKISYQGFELFTDEPPYAITVNLKTDTETRNYYAGEAFQKPFENNAIILFALIGNVEYVNFSVDDGMVEPYSMQYTRQWADINFDKDIREFAVSEETFGELLEKLNGTPHKYTAAVLTEYEKGKDKAQVKITDIENLNRLYSLLQTGEDTKKESINDVPNEPKYIHIEFRPVGGIPNYYIYEKNSKYYIEIPYHGIWEISYDVMEEIMSMLGNKNNENITSAIEIDKLLSVHFETIMKKPKTSSNPNDYIKANQETFDEILSYGDSALLYCYRLFEKGGQRDLKGHLMMAACRSLCIEEDIDLSATTGQDWYNAFKDNAVNMQSKLGEAGFEKHMPKSYLLLQFLNGKTGNAATVCLPHFSYSGEDKILKLVYDTEISRYQNYHNENAFCIPAVRVFNATQQENKLKIFATIYSGDYVLYDKNLKSVGGSVIPVAITYTENADGSYSLEEYLQAQDGTGFAPSIKEFCTFPLSGSEIPGLADKILDHYGNYEDLHRLQKNNLINHLNIYNQTGISLVTDYDDSVMRLN